VANRYPKIGLRPCYSCVELREGLMSCGTLRAASLLVVGASGRSYSAFCCMQVLKL
jgi:hypothetical protein